MSESYGLIKSMALGQVSAFLAPLEVTQWQALTKWTYHTAVARIQTRVRAETRLYFVRRNSNIVDEVRAPSGRCSEHRQDFEASRSWLVTQLRSDLFFVVGHDFSSRRSGFLVNDGRAQFAEVRKADRIEARVGPALSTLHDRFVFVSGGWKKRSVERYDVANDTWQLVPQLNGVRWRHASVAVGRLVYVVCGSDDRRRLYSFERLDTSLADSGAARWELIPMPEIDLTPRDWPVAAAISATELIILGGKDDKSALLDDAVICDARDNKCTWRKLSIAGFGFMSNAQVPTATNRQIYFVAHQSASGKPICCFGNHDAQLRVLKGKRK